MPERFATLLTGGHLNALCRTEEAVGAVRAGDALLQLNLTTSGDWIVLNTTMDVAAGWARGSRPGELGR